MGQVEKRPCPHKESRENPNEARIPPFPVPPSQCGVSLSTERTLSLSLPSLVPCTSGKVDQDPTVACHCLAKASGIVVSTFVVAVVVVVVVVAADFVVVAGNDGRVANTSAAASSGTAASGDPLGSPAWPRHVESSDP